jgi:hypothetical protein
MKILTMLSIFLLCVSASAKDSNEKEKRAPAGVDTNVQIFELASQYSRSEKWVDCATGVVCYSASPGGASAMAMSCVKIAEAWCKKSIEK